MCSTLWRRSCKEAELLGHSPQRAEGGLGHRGRSSLGTPYAVVCKWRVAEGGGLGAIMCLCACTPVSGSQGQTLTLHIAQTPAPSARLQRSTPVCVIIECFALDAHHHSQNRYRLLLGLGAGRTRAGPGWCPWGGVGHVRRAGKLPACEGWPDEGTPYAICTST
jgi:hypothetical protein